MYIYRDGYDFPLVVYIRKSEKILSVCGFLSSNLVNVNMWPKVALVKLEYHTVCNMAGRSVKLK